MPGKSLPVKEPPSELKSVKQFILRGNQLRNADPVITYYCYFWAIKQILGSGLHSSSAECTAWTSDLMDELERRKEALGNNELLSDDMAAQAYVENFALKIFNNGSSMVEAGKATSQTSDTLLAGATILEVSKVFCELDAEALQKIKYAKFHAARIWKAIQSGQDPNPPKPEVIHTEPPPDIYGNDSSLHTEPPPDIYGNDSPGSHRPPAPTIEEVPDESVQLGPRLARTSIHNESLHPTPFPAPQQSPEEMTQNLPSPPTSPAKPHEYFPEVPTVHEPSVPSLFPTTMGPANAAFPDISPYNPPHPSAPGYPPDPYSQGPIRPYHSAPSPQGPVRPYPPAPSQPMHAPQYSEPVHQLPSPAAAPPKRVKMEITAEDMAKAQKSARWAISALDYEDVETAIKQFKLGLQLLGVE